MYINSPGGVVTSGLSIYDTMQYMKPQGLDPRGRAGGVDGLPAADCGREGDALQRSPTREIMVHQPSGGYQGQATDIMIHAKRDRSSSRSGSTTST